MERCEQEATALKVNLEKVTQEGKNQQAELSKKAQSLRAELQKSLQEKEAQRKELSAAQESLETTNKALKESQTQLDSEKKNHKSALEEMVGLNVINIRLFTEQHVDTESCILSQSSEKGQ